MMRILKFELPQHGTVGIPLSSGGYILKVGKQRNKLVVWTLDVPTEETATIDVVHTGEEYNPTSLYIGTVAFHHLADEDFVVHVFLRDSFDPRDPRALSSRVIHTTRSA